MSETTLVRTARAIKTLDANGCSPYQGRRWPLPTQRADGTWTPGEWVTSRHAVARKTPLTPPDVDACVPAVYGCRPDQVIHWLAPQAFWAEFQDPVEGKDKVAGTRGRLVAPVEGWSLAMATLAHECADRAVRIHAPAALRAVGLSAEADRLTALAPITDAPTARAAARAAAWAAEAAAEAAAWAAASAAARAAARAAAWAAAWDAASATAAAAAEAAEREWQATRLAELLGWDTESR